MNRPLFNISMSSFFPRILKPRSDFMYYCPIHHQNDSLLCSGIFAITKLYIKINDQLVIVYYVKVL